MSIPHSRRVGAARERVPNTCQEYVSVCLQGYLAHKKQRPPRTLQKEHAQGPVVVLRGWALSYE